MVSCDLAIINEALRDAVRQRISGLIPEISPEQVFLNATHTHSAPYVATDENSESIYGIKLDAYIGLSLSAGYKTARIKAISGVTTSNGDTFGVVDEDEFVVSRLIETDPNTGALWTATNLNAAEFGVEVMS
jgi:hypothetical protein